jgi:DNA polymerase-3 subunit alpha
VTNDDYTGGLRVGARRLFDLAAARSAYASLLKLSCNGQADALKLRELLAPYRRAEPASETARSSDNHRGCAVQIEYHNADARVELALGDQWRVELRDELLHGLKSWLSEENVKILYN